MYEKYVDLGITVENVRKLGIKIGISLNYESDLLWIAYLYCGFLIKFNS